MEDSQSSNSCSNSSHNNDTVKESEDPLPGPLKLLLSDAYGKKGDRQRS